MLAALRRVAVKVCATAVLAAAVAGVPAWLVIVVGWPLPSHFPSGDSLAAAINGTVTDQMVVNTIAIGIWLTWAAFTHAVIAEAHAVLRGRATLRPTRNPLRSAATVLIGAALMGTVMSATAAASASSPASAATTPPQAAPTRAAAIVVTEAAAPATTVHVGTQRYTYTVVRGDYLSKIAQTWLGDPDRWPEICNLNWHKHFPSVGGALTDCNLIYPGWDLILPADATPPPGAVPAPAIPPAPATPPAPAPTTPSRATSPSAATASPPASVTTPASASPAPHPSASAAPSANTSAAASATPAGQEPSGKARADEHGISLPGSTWVPWAFAVAVTAAGCAVWLQRRRRYRGELDEQPLTDLPNVVTELRREVHTSTTITLPADDAGKAAAVPDLTLLPRGGIGLVGDGAHDAARAAVAQTLASGGPLRPAARGEVIIDANTLITLIGPDAITLGPWPRLHIADNLDHALTLVMERLLHRSRLLDEYDLSDVDTLAAQEPGEEPLPPILLITETPSAGSRQHAKTTIALGAGLGVSALLLGEWPYGPTLSVSVDGHTQLTSGQAAADIPARLAVLETDPAIAILATLREAHTGEPTPTTATPIPAKRAETPVPAAKPAVPADEKPEQPAAGKAKLRVLGKPDIANTTASGYHVRGKAIELAVYLACYRDGKTVPQLVDVLEAEGRARQAEGRVHNNISNLRRALTEYSGLQHRYIIKDEARRHKFDPATIDVDLWRLHSLVTEARNTPAPARRDLLRQACDLYAPLADGETWEWLAPHAETVRRLGLHAHLTLAEDLLASDPHTASTLLDAAIVIDPYNETAYTQAMRARHATGDGDGIRHLLRALTKALSDVDAEPGEDTIELARQLRASLGNK
jgi:DNA-binding SARP family transcriptional activator